MNAQSFSRLRLLVGTTSGVLASHNRAIRHAQSHLLPSSKLVCKQTAVASLPVIADMNSTSLRVV